MIVTIAHLTQPDYIARAKSSQKIQLLTIPYSHYVEFSRWSLKYMNVEFEEYKFSPIEHILPILSTRISKRKEKYIPQTTRTQVINEGKSSKNASGVTSVPVAVLPTGDILVDSWDIAQYSGLAPPSDELKLLLDSEVGPMVRQYFYYFIMKDINLNIWNQLCTDKKGFVWKFLWWAGLGSMSVKRIRRAFHTENKALIQHCRDQLIVLFTKLDTILNASSGKYIYGNTVSMADIAVAALTAPMVNPPGYCGGEYYTLLHQLEVQDKEYQEQIEYFRKTKIGQFTSFMYETHRFDTVTK